MRRAFPAPSISGRTAKIRRNRRPQLRALEAARVHGRIRRYGPGPNAAPRLKAAWRHLHYGTEASAPELAA